MKHKQNMTAVAVAAALLAGAVHISAHAGMAVGGSVGSARINDGDFEGDETGWKAYIGGYGGILGGEINYVDFGDLGGQGPSARAWAPAVTAGIPVGMASIYGKFGVAFADVEGSSVREEYSDEDPFYGVGARFGSPQGVGVRIEYERYQLEREDLDQASIGLEFRFQ